MRVAVDARAGAFHEKTGVGIYTWNLLRWLPRVDRKTTYLAWYLDARRRRGSRRFAEIASPNLVERPARIPARLFEPLARRFGVPRLEWLARFDVLFAPNFIPPPTRVGRLVITVHDLAFRRIPSSAPERTRRWLGGLDGVLGRASRIIVPSEATRRDAVELFGVAPDRTVVIPHGVDARFRPPSAEEVDRVRSSLGISGPYLVFVGGIEPRKNLPTLVRAFAKLPAGGPALVIAGSSVAWNPEGLEQLEDALRAVPAEMRSRIVRTGYVDRAVTPALIGGAVALVFPSLYEGFGMPVLEAMACGTPVLTSATSALPEVAGDASLMVDPMDVEGMAEGMRRLIEDEELRAVLREAGLRRAGGYTWEGSARRTAEVLRAA